MDPTLPLPPPAPAPKPEKEATLAGALQAQLQLAVSIQERLADPSERLEPRDFKDLVSAASGIVALAHRSDEALRTISTYERAFAVVFEFLRRRGDAIGEDLVSELRSVARDLHAENDLRDAEKWREGA
jgi:hypothetical protein